MGRRDCIQAFSTNISLTGMHVFASEVCPIGTELACDLVLPTACPNLALKGRVSWVASERDSHMGIEFLDLSDGDVRLLRDIVEEAPPLADARPAKVWFEGLPQPLPARVLGVGPDEGAKRRARGDAEIELKIAFPYLEEGAEVVLSFADDEESLTGNIRGIRFEATPGSGHSLKARVDLPAPRAAAELRPETWTRWPPPPLPSLCGGVQGPRGELVVVEEAPPALPAELLGPVPESRSSEDSLASLFAPAAIPPVVEPAVLPDQPPAPNGLALFEPSLWEIRSKTAEIAALRGEAGRAKRKRHIGLWLAACAMAGIAVASMLHTDLFPRAKKKLAVIVEKADPEALWRWVREKGGSLADALSPSQVSIEEASSAVAIAAGEEKERAAGEEGVPTAKLASPVAPEPEPEPGIKPGSDPEEDPAKAAGGAKAVASVSGEAPDSKPLVVEEPDGATLFVNVTGSLRDARSYPLADPDGLVINLPHAGALVRGDHTLMKGGFRTVWVRRRSGGGLQIRVFSSGKMPAHRLSLEGKTVKVTLLRKSASK